MYNNYRTLSILGVLAFLGGCLFTGISTRAAEVGSSSNSDVIRVQEAQVSSLVDLYRDRLGLDQDPFDWVFTQEQGNELLTRLLVKPMVSDTSLTSVLRGQWVPSPLARIRTQLLENISQWLELQHRGQGAARESALESSDLFSWSNPNSGVKFSPEIVASILEEIRNDLSASSSIISKTDLQSNLFALRTTSEYLRRFKIPEAVVDRDGETPPEQTPSPKPPGKQPSKKQKQDPTPEVPPEYPDLPTEYQPHTKDTEKSSVSGQQTQYRLAEVNFKTPFFAQRYFSEIVRGATNTFREIALPTQFMPPKKGKDTGRELVLRTFGKLEVNLFLPPLVRPLQPKEAGAKITRSETGAYVLHLDQPLAEVHIPLEEANGIRLSLPVQEVYTKRVGFNLNEWPDEVQAAILRKQPPETSKNQPLQVAQAISRYLSSQYLYSVGERAETDPVDALNAGAFQCDMASYIMVSLLRDVYQIPSRVVGGYRAKSHQSGKDGKSYLILPGEAHAWVEVFDQGQWHYFDPTPVKKDRKDKKESGEKDEYRDIPVEDTPPSPSDEDSQEAGSQYDHSQDGESTSSDAEKGKDGEGKDQDPQGDKDDSKEKSEENTAKKRKAQDQDPHAEPEMTSEELADLLEIGSLELEPKLGRNPFVERAVRILLQIATNPTQDGLAIQNRLNQISSLLRRIPGNDVKSIFQEATAVHSSRHPDLRLWIEELARLANSREIAQTYQDLVKIRKSIEIFSRVIDQDSSANPSFGRVKETIPVPYALLEKLRSAQMLLETLAHPDSNDIALVQDLVNGLPSVPRLLLKNQYDLTQVGPNAPTRNVAQALKAGRLNDLRLLAILNPVSDFILNSTPRPEMVEIKTWLRNFARPRGRDILPLQRFTDLSRSFMGQPGKSMEQNIQDGTAYVMSRRKRVRISTGHGKDNAERITIVLYDTSGSMDGDPARFQAGLISAFTSRALSDLTISGKHRHRVVIVPFDDQVGNPVRVTNTQEALDVITHYRTKMANTGGGTDIQKALMQAMALIADAERRSGEPLAAANIILMTDGQASVQPEELLKARNAIDRTTPLQTLFVAINGTSEELMQYSIDAASMGAEKGMYREFPPELIRDFLHQADHLDLTRKKDVFYSDKTVSEIPQGFYSLLDGAMRDSRVWSDQIRIGSLYFSARENLESLETLRWSDHKHAERPLEDWLIRARRFVLHPAFKDKTVFDRVLDDLLIYFERISGVPLADLSGFEQEQLRHLVRFAAGLESGF